jgi:hypothetical protein
MIVLIHILPAVGQYRCQSCMSNNGASGTEDHHGSETDVGDADSDNGNMSTPEVGDIFFLPRAKLSIWSSKSMQATCTIQYFRSGGDGDGGDPC